MVQHVLDMLTSKGDTEEIEVSNISKLCLSLRILTGRK